MFWGLNFLVFLGGFFSYNGCCRCGIDARADPESITETFGRGGGRGGDHGRRWWKPIQIEIVLIFFLIFFLLEKGLSLFIVVNRFSLLLFLLHSRQVMCAVDRRKKKDCVFANLAHACTLRLGRVDLTTHTHVLLTFQRLRMSPSLAMQRRHPSWVCDVPHRLPIWKNHDRGFSQTILGD